MKIGLVGLPNVGKSTLFNALSKAGAKVSNYPFCTVEPNHGIAAVPDDRLTRLGEIFHQQKIIPATVEFVDIAGLVKGASRGEGLGNQFLHHIREVDAVLHVVRCFPSAEIGHVEGDIDPVRDIEIVNLELALADLARVGKRMEEARPHARSGDAAAVKETKLLERIQTVLNAGQPARSASLQKEEWAELADLNLLTSKPVLYLANISEEEMRNYARLGADFVSSPLVGEDKGEGELTPTLTLPRQGGGSNEPPASATEQDGIPDRPLAKLKRYLTAKGEMMVSVAAKLEADLAELSDEERAEFAAELALQPAAAEVIKACYKLLGLITFFTGVGAEVRAWAIPAGTHAQEAAGKIHSDMARGFIRAEVIPFPELAAAGAWETARQAGHLRSEGKDSIIHEGDVCHFRFSV